MKINYSKNVENLPKYLFVMIEDLIKEKEKEGVDLIRLGVGIPDLKTPKFIIDKLVEEIQKPEHHFYTLSSSAGEPSFNESISRFYEIRFHVKLDSKKETTNLIGAKEGLVNLARTFLNEGDYTLVPDPGYPVYANGATILNGGKPYAMPLDKENKFLPDLEKIPKDIAKKAKIMFLNYPNNPTAAIAPESFIKEALDFAEDNNVIICYDNAYSEITFDGYVAPSILEFEKGREHIELNSFSKTFAMAGDRIAWAAGNEEIISGLVKVKSQIDMASPTYIQAAAKAALDSYVSSEPPPEVKKLNAEYEKRRDIIVDGLNDIGFECEKPKATFYVWFDCGQDSTEFTKKMINAGVVVTPGVGFGSHSKNFVRISLVQTEEKLKEAIERMKKAAK